MTWFCQDCKVQNGDRSERCRQCNQHWEKVWIPPRKKTRSKSRSHGKDKQKEKAAEVKPEEDLMQVVTARAPWVTSTPSRATSIRLEAMHGSQNKETGPKTSFSPLTPVNVEASGKNLTSEEIKKLEYLRGLHGMGIELTQVMSTQLEELQNKEQSIASAKVLSHGHLNRYNKLKAQVESSAKKVTDLDSEWTKFMEQTMNKIRLHAEMYQSCRSDLLEAHNQKLAELHAIKHEVSAASQSLVGQNVEFNAPMDAPQVDTQILAMQDLLQKEGMVAELPDQIDLTRDDFSMEEMDDAQGPSATLSKKGVQLKAFRAATSPTKVANQHLKQKAEPKEGKVKQPEDK